MQVVYFFDPAKALTAKETEFMLLAVKEKLTMILESNPRVAGCVDLGQFEKLKELRDNQEIQEMRQALVRKGHEITELRQNVTQLQEDLPAMRNHLLRIVKDTLIPNIEQDYILLSLKCLMSRNEFTAMFNH